MMRAQELRIGNYYDFSNSGQIEQITGKDIYEFESDPIDDIYHPIPLTKKWLVKLGFEFDKDGYFHLEILSKGVINIYIINIVTVELGTKGGYLFGCPPIEHVHQLQNLYFALTGEGLTIKE